MWNWIVRVIGNAAGIVAEDVRKWVGGLISGVFGFIHTVFHLVGGAYDDVLHGAEWLAGEVAPFIREMFAKIWWLAYVALRDIEKWVNHLIREAVAFTMDVYKIALHEFDLLRHYAASLFDDARRWVMKYIWTPLFRFITTAWHWITHEGSVLWYYITHPEKLVDLLWTHLLVKIEREAWNIGRLLGRFFVSLVFHNMRQFVVLLEDILDAIL